MSYAVITIRIAPDIDLGPITIAWHGLTIAVGILIGSLAAAYAARERGLDRDPLFTITAIIAIAGIVGGRLFYVVEQDPSDILDPSALVSSRGFTFAGGVILAALLVFVYVRRAGLSPAYLDMVAAGLPLGVAIGRIGDVINGEHYGPPSDFFLAVRNAHPDALTPDSSVAYQNGGLYEVLLALLILAVVWPLRHRLRRTGDLAWLVLALFALGRFFMFFLRDDSPELALGLSNGQWTSVALLALIAIGRTWSARRADAAP